MAHFIDVAPQRVPSALVHVARSFTADSLEKQQLIKQWMSRDFPGASVYVFRVKFAHDALLQM